MSNAYANSEFWTHRGDAMTVVGDFLGRQPAIEMLAARESEVLLDAGCGAGFTTRMAARSAADLKVYGCDLEQNMLDAANREETKLQLGIQYHRADVTSSLPYPSGHFNGIVCIGVAIHFSPEECAGFFREVFRVLKPGGRLIVGVTHPYVYQHGSPHRDCRATWQRLEPQDCLPMEQSQRFHEQYRNSTGEIFEAEVWYHPPDFFSTVALDSGLLPVREQGTYVTQEVLDKCNQVGGVGYPAFYQFLCKKPLPNMVSHFHGCSSQILGGWL